MSKVLFSKDDCEFIKSFWSDINSLDGKGYGTTTYNNQHLNIRREVKGHYLNLTDDDLLTFILPKLNPIGIVGITSGMCKLTNYQAGDYFRPHRDFQIDDRGRVRKTLVIQLSKSTEYIGGDLVIEGVVQSRLLGSCILLNSNALHEITLIESGIRNSLVLFLFDEDINITNSLI